jgi:hypothetical protein
MGSTKTDSGQTQTGGLPGIMDQTDNILLRFVHLAKRPILAILRIQS